MSVSSAGKLEILAGQGQAPVPEPVWKRRRGDDAGKAEHKKIVLFTNWTKKPVTVDGGVKVAAGIVRGVEAQSDADPQDNGGKDEGDKDLGKFRLKLAPLEVNLIRIIPVAGK